MALRHATAVALHTASVGAEPSVRKPRALVFEQALTLRCVSVVGGVDMLSDIFYLISDYMYARNIINVETGCRLLRMGYTCF